MGANLTVSDRPRDRTHLSFFMLLLLFVVVVVVVVVVALFVDQKKRVTRQRYWYCALLV